MKIDNRTEVIPKGRKRKRSLKNIEKKKIKLNEESIPEENGKAESGVSEVPLLRHSDDPIPKKAKWTNKQRVLIFASRGITYRDRHLMEDLKLLLPHCKPETKKEKKDDLIVINEIAEMRNCNKCIYFDSKKQKDLYMWISNITKGPSIKFYVQNVHSMKELKLTGNSLKGTRPFLSFDPIFDSAPHLTLMKEMLGQVFNAPNGHPKTQPFFDHVFVFSMIDDKVWFRNYQIVDEDGQLTEIGPRFVLNPIKIFDGSFSGAVLWSNSKYVSPNQFRHDQRLEDAAKHSHKKAQQNRRDERAPSGTFIGDTTSDFFETKPPEVAKGKEKQMFVRKKVVKKRGKGGGQKGANNQKK